MNINWKVRLMSKVFWMALIPAVLLLIQAILVLFGVSFDVEPLTGQLLAIIDAVFVLLVILGITADPTTEGITDSKQAMTYTEPKVDEA